MLKQIFYVLCCLGLGSTWGYKIYEGLKNQNKFEIVYCSVVTSIFVIMAILKVIEIFIG